MNVTMAKATGINQTGVRVSTSYIFLFLPIAFPLQ